MSLFRCPLCARPLEREGSALRCPEGHSFDLAREGYVHLLPPNQKHSVLPGDGREVEEGVGGTANHHIRRNGVGEGGWGHNLGGLPVRQDHLHNPLPRIPGQAEPSGMNRRNGAVPRQGHPQGLGHALHGAGGHGQVPVLF